MRRRSFLRLAAATGAAVALPLRAGAAAPANAAPLRIGLTGDYRPFSFYDAAKDTWEGLDVDVAHALAASLGRPAVIVRTSWPKMTADLAADLFDVAMGGVSRNKERADAGILTRPYVIDGKVALIRAADRATYATLADLDRPEVRVGMNLGGTNEQFVRANLTHANVIVDPSNLAIPPGVAAGTYDVMITDGVEAALYAGRDPRLAVMNAAKPFTRIEKVYFLQKNATALAAAVDAWMAQREADGSYAKWRTAWIGSNLNAPPAS